jgi:multidrug efflux pump subunit AcrA (membrane-fusion protein)
MLLKRELRNETLTQASDLVLELTTVQSEVQVVKAYLDDLFSAYSKSLPDGAFTQSVLDTNKANIQLARLSIASTLSSVVSARATLSASLTANQVAGSGGTASSGSLLSADAQVKQALGAYNAAQSRLEKTIIRSPISGTLNSLSINTGDYISAFTQVAVVSNNGALEIISFVTEDDAKRITVGSPVTINGSISGVVTRIASAIDSTTKKIELRVGIKDMKSELINGQSVTLTIERNKNNIVHNPNTPIVVPLSALKLTPRGTYIFTVSASNTLISIPVKEGAILGEQIQILQGLTGSESIVTDARGLKEGMAVTVAK